MISPEAMNQYPIRVRYMEGAVGIKSAYILRTDEVNKLSYQNGHYVNGYPIRVETIDVNLQNVATVHGNPPLSTYSHLKIVQVPGRGIIMHDGHRLDWILDAMGLHPE